MTPDIDPKNFGQLARQANNPPAVKQDEKPAITIPALTRKHMANSEFFSNHPVLADIISYYVMPAVQNGVHKTLSAAVDFFILDKPLKPSNNKQNGVYIYSDGRRDYTSYSQPTYNYQASGTYLGADGKMRPINSDRYRKPSKASFVRIPKYDQEGNLCPWDIGEVEEFSDMVGGRLADCINNSDWVSVQDLYDACGQSGAPSTANNFGWPSIKGLSVTRAVDNACYVIVKMPCDPQEIKDNPYETKGD